MRMTHVIADRDSRETGGTDAQMRLMNDVGHSQQSKEFAFPYKARTETFRGFSD